MYFELDSYIRDNEELSTLKAEIHRFAKEVVRPAAKKLDLMDYKETNQPNSPYFEVMKKMKKQGYHRLLVPEEYGGLALGPEAFCILYEELAWGSVGFATALGVDMVVNSILAIVGGEEVKNEILMPWMNDEEDKYRGCWSVMDPERGSDYITALSLPNPEELGTKGFTVARQDGDHWVINGVKSYWTSSGPCANWALTHPLVPPYASPADVGMAIIPLNLPGVTVAAPINKLGMRDDPQGEITFDNVRIPEHYMLMSDPFLAKPLLKVLLSNTSCAIANMYVGVARAAFEDALAYTQQRVQGGKAIIDHQLTKYRLFKMFEKVETARYFVRAVTKNVHESVFKEQTFDQSTPHAFIAQAYCKQQAFDVASEALQLFGGAGILKEMQIEKLFRDARCGLIEDGTVEILGLTAIEEALDLGTYTLD